MSYQVEASASVNDILMYYSDLCYDDNGPDLASRNKLEVQNADFKTSGVLTKAGVKAITINPALICGVSDRVGSIEVGKDADIAIFSGNPMETFTETVYTIVDGKIVYQRKE